MLDEFLGPKRQWGSRRSGISFYPCKWQTDSLKLLTLLSRMQSCKVHYHKFQHLTERDLILMNWSCFLEYCSIFEMLNKLTYKSFITSSESWMPFLCKLHARHKFDRRCDQLVRTHSHGVSKLSATAPWQNATFAMETSKASGKLCFSTLVEEWGFSLGWVAGWCIYKE